MSDGLLIMRSPCDQCLFSKARIVSEKRAREVVATCLREDRHFECHKGTLEGEEIVCANFYKKHGKDVRSIRLAHALDVVRFVDGPKEEHAP